MCTSKSLQIAASVLGCFIWIPWGSQFFDSLLKDNIWSNKFEPLLPVTIDGFPLWRNPNELVMIFGKLSLKLLKGAVSFWKISDARFPGFPPAMIYLWRSTERPKEILKSLFFTVQWKNSLNSYQNFFSLILTNLDQTHRYLLKIITIGQNLEIWIFSFNSKKRRL